MAQAGQLRRLAAGDWVLACDAAAAVSPGLGKLSGGDYEGTTLVRARVEFPSGVRTVVPGDLRRVTPEDEATLVAHALSSGLVLAPAREALERALDAMRSGEQRYVRTPGLLDRLWVVFRDSGEDRCPGLAELFESGLAELQPILLAGRPQPVPLAWPVVEPLARSATVPSPRRPAIDAAVDVPSPVGPVSTSPLEVRPAPGGLERIYALVELGARLPWGSLQELGRGDVEVAQAYLLDRVPLDDLELAYRFGSTLAARALERLPRKRVLTYRLKAEAAFEEAFRGRWRQSLAYHYLVLADVLSAWCARGPRGREVAHSFAPLLGPVGAWLVDGAAVESQLSAVWAQVVATRAARLSSGFPEWGDALRALSRALGGLTRACAPLPSASCVSQDQARWDRALRLVHPVYDAIAALHPESKNLRKQVRWVEVRAADGLVRWLFAREWAHPW